jgi:hypothetical protein
LISPKTPISGWTLTANFKAIEALVYLTVQDLNSGDKGQWRSLPAPLDQCIDRKSAAPGKKLDSTVGQVLDKSVQSQANCFSS